MSVRCPFCNNDPFHYVHNGLGYEPVAVDCCEGGCALYSRHDTPARRLMRKVLTLRRSHSPRRKARAQRLLAAFESGDLA